MKLTESEQYLIMSTLQDKVSKETITKEENDLLKKIRFVHNGWKEFDLSGSFNGTNVLKLVDEEENEFYGVIIGIPGFVPKICLLQEIDGRPIYHSLEDFKGWRGYDDREHE